MSSGQGGGERAPVSVVMPVHNGERYLAAALDSALAQTLLPAEIIVIDDGSTDGTAALLAGYGDRVQVLRHASATGPARARNDGLRQAGQPWVAFLDADDLWERRKLERQVGFAREHPDFGIVTTDASGFDDRGRVVRTALPRPIPQGQVLEPLLRTNWIVTSAAMVPRAVLLEAGGFDERPCRLGEDWVTWMHIASRHPVYFLDEVLTRRRIHPDSLGHADPEATFHDLLEHLERLQQDIPHLAARPELVRRAAYEICLYRGSQDWHHLRSQAARSKFRRARQYAHLPLRAYAWSALAAVPPAWVQRGKQYKRRLLGRHVSEPPAIG